MEVDLQLDSIGVLLDHPMYCGFCMVKMNALGKDGKESFRCPKCGSTYTEIHKSNETNKRGAV